MPPAEPPPRPTPPAARRWRERDALRAAWRERCPNCREGKAFRSLYALQPTCPVCGVRFERDAGSWLGAAVLAYALATLAVGVVMALLFVRYGLFPGIEWWLVATALVTILLVYRPVKAIWLWIMWVAGWFHRDREDPEAPG
jgi:uncharacterized protein (DUF983 family)